MSTTWSRVAFLIVALCSANAARAGEFNWCLGDGLFCAESPIEHVGSSCGEDYYFARGRVSSPLLEGVGTITIAINTSMVNNAYALPLYVELVPTDSCSTRGQTVRFLLFEVHGSYACGGVWQSIGPLDLAHYVTPGTPYTIQLTFFDADAVPLFRSVAASCLHVTTSGGTSLIATATWGGAKAIYR